MWLLSNKNNYVKAQQQGVVIIIFSALSMSASVSKSNWKYVFTQNVFTSIIFTK